VRTPSAADVERFRSNAVAVICLILGTVILWFAVRSFRLGYDFFAALLCVAASAFVSAGLS
jgi:hypothetical protein